MNRRDFTRLSALSLAATQVGSAPLFGQAAPGKKIGFAVIGLGRIAQAFMEQVASSNTVEVTAFVTGHPDKGKEWAQKYNVPNAKIYTYETAADLKQNTAVQAVYVATPNALHLRDTVAAAKAGKHVLCEKPMAISSAECRTMIDACKQANVKLLIAYRMHYDRLHLQAKEIISSGNLGKITVVEGSFGFNIRQGEWRYNKKLAGGGPLFDVGVYPLNAICFLLGERPTSYTATVGTTDKTSGRFNEIEESMAWTMTMPSGALAACTTSYGANLPGLLRLHGEKGILDFDNPFGNGGIHLTGRYGSTKVDDSTPREATQLRLEAEHLAECIHNNTTPNTPGEEGLKDHLAFEAIYKAAGHPL
jgi:predicted dehydrogenase